MESTSIPPPVQEMLDTLKGGIDSISLKLMLQESYESIFKIFDHNNELALKHRPLALVALHPKENASHYSMLYKTIRRYHKLNVLGSCGIPLDRFLELPHDIVELLFDLASQAVRSEGNQVTDAFKKLDQDMRQGR